MTMFKTKDQNAELLSARIREQSEANAALRQRVAELEAERAALEAQLAGNIPHATRFLQTKVWRQRAHLDRLERRLRSQRVALRAVAELGRGLSQEEWNAARKAAVDAERLEEKVPQV